MRRVHFSPVLPLTILLLIGSLRAPAARQQPEPRVATPTRDAPVKQTPPRPGAPKNFVVPKPTRFTLPNGLPVTLVAFGNVPKVRIQLMVDAGNVHEKANQVWLADTTGQMLEQGTASLTADALARELAGMGGELSITVGPDQTTIVTDVLAEQGPPALRVLADVVEHPRLPDTELARVKANLLRNLAIQKSSPQAIALEKFSALMYGDHPYGRVFPTEAMLQSYTLDDVRGFHRDHFGPRRARLYVAGVFEPGAMEKAAREAFGAWTGGVEKSSQAPITRGSDFALIDRPDAPQSTIMLGLRVPDPSSREWIALEVTNSLLGGSFASRITSNIREQKGYTYSPVSTIDTHPKDARWVEQADVATAVTGAALKEVFAEIDRLRRETPAADELRGIQNNLAGVFVVQNASRGGLIGRLSFVDQHGVGDEYLSSYVQRIMAITPDEVRRTASEYFVPDRMMLVVVGDAKTVKDQLAPWSKAQKR
jgi:zinc protease